jgi:hypothetical protein
VSAPVAGPTRRLTDAPLSHVPLRRVCIVMMSAVGDAVHCPCSPRCGGSIRRRT